MYFCIIAAISWLVAQTTKVALESIFARKLLLHRYCGDGGYPSCHSAFVTGFAVANLFEYDWNNWLSKGTDAKILGVVLVLWFLTTRDSMGARKQVGDTAKNVNVIVKFLDTIGDNIFKLIPILKQQGHLPHEVIAGVVTGVIAGTSCVLFDRGNSLASIIIGGTGIIIIVIIGIIINAKRNHMIVSKYWGENISSINTDESSKQKAFNDFAESIGLTGSENASYKKLLTDVVSRAYKKDIKNKNRLIKNLYDEKEWTEVSKNLTKMFEVICNLQPGAKEESKNLSEMDFIKAIVEYIQNNKKVQA